jgi:hypothetical protein
MVDIEDRVRSILGGELVWSVDDPKYQAFARQVFSMQRHLGGGKGLILEVGLSQSKWTARGNESTILDRIREDLFSIPASVPPDS